jgi:hypothetical protein
MVRAGIKLPRPTKVETGLLPLTKVEITTAKLMPRRGKVKGVKVKTKAFLMM